MKLVTLLLVGGLCAAIWWKSGAPLGASPGSAGPWLEVPGPAGADPKRVLIVAAPNCPRAESQRALALARELAAQEIPSAQTGTVSFAITSDLHAKRLEQLMSAGAPIVFINGKAKSNPSAAEVIAEFRALASR
jgi:hypothetical protein